jgi:NADPH:quinone reductase-like Zn-dependent oxidoreductase
MKAAFYEDYGAPQDVCTIKSVDKPTVGKKDVLVKTQSAGVNPVDWKLMGGHIQSWPHKAPFIPGWDISGVVEEVGEEVKEFKAGDEVYSYHRPEFNKDKTDVITTNGCYAEYASVPAHRLAKRPTKASWNEAAAIPLAGLTAWQGLHNILKPTKGQTLLVLGGSGGVGGFAVQFGKAAGCTVIATCSKKNVEYVKGLGADHVVDYTAGDVAAAVKAIASEGVDIVFDSVGGDSTKDGLAALKKGHTLATCANWGVADLAKAEEKVGQAFLVSPSSENLTAIAALFDSGAVKVPSITTFPLDKAADALTASMGGRTVGKIVLEVNK